MTTPWSKRTNSQRTEPSFWHHKGLNNAGGAIRRFLGQKRVELAALLGFWKLTHSLALLRRCSGWHPKPVPSGQHAWTHRGRRGSWLPDVMTSVQQFRRSSSASCEWHQVKWLQGTTGWELLVHESQVNTYFVCRNRHQCHKNKQNGFPGVESKQSISHFLSCSKANPYIQNSDFSTSVFTFSLAWRSPSGQNQHVIPRLTAS